MAGANDCYHSITSTISPSEGPCAKRALRLLRDFIRGGAIHRNKEAIRQDALFILAHAEDTLQRALLEFVKYNEYVREEDYHEFIKLLTEHER